MTSGQPLLSCIILGIKTYSETPVHKIRIEKKTCLIYSRQIFWDIRFPSNGIVICQVGDSLGTYINHKEIVGRGEVHLFIYKST